MCRSISEGGRRCPCGRGDRRRAYARSRYAARTAEAARRAANTAEFDSRAASVRDQLLVALSDPGDGSSPADGSDAPPQGSVADPVIERRYDVAAGELSGEQREQLRTYATERARVSAQTTRAAFAALAGAPTHRDSPARRAYESALQEQGRHLAAVADVTLHEHLRDALPDPEDPQAPGSVSWAARVIADSGFAHSDGTVMTAKEVRERVRSGHFDAEAMRRYLDMTATLREGEELVRARRGAAHASALRATLEQVDPAVTFGGADLGAGDQPVVWGTGMTKAKRAQFAEALSCAYPDRLIEHARDNGRPLRVRVTSARAHYQPSGARERIPAAHYLDARELIAAAEAVGDADIDPEVRAARLQLAAGYTTRYTEARTAVPAQGGVADTEANRAALEAAFAAWSPSHNEYSDKRFAARMGSAPQIHAVDGMLYVTSKKRVAALDGAPVAELTTNGATNVTVHEMAHRIEEHAPAVSAACHAFLARRTAGLDPTVYNTSVRRGRRVVEKVREDAFVDPYVGRDYGPDQPHTEVFSVGMEALVTGRFGGLTDSPESGWADKQRRADPEHRQLVLALLASTADLLDAAAP